MAPSNKKILITCRLVAIIALGCIAFPLMSCGGQGEKSKPIATSQGDNMEPSQPIQTPSDLYEGFEESENTYEARQRLVSNSIEARGIQAPDVLRAMRTVPRHMFVPDEYLSQAYADHPLPIGYGQTISQPYVVAWMTELLDLQPGERVLEIGTGSGYQAAVLAALGTVEVYSIEIVPELADRATSVLDRLNYNVLVKQGDGYYGWLEYAPFDAIIVTAAPDHLPSPLVEQLTEDGRIVIPIGPPGGIQSLWKFIYESGELKAYNIGGVRFVPFTGEGVLSGE
jgi:protein-L-isoaspartate(D-aspartate) O-methyltransferase